MEFFLLDFFPLFIRKVDFNLPCGWKVGTITTMNSKQIIKQLEADGWLLVRVKGSHHQFKHPFNLGLVTVKHPDSDVPAGTLNSIKKQAGWK